MRRPIPYLLFLAAAQLSAADVGKVSVSLEQPLQPKLAVGSLFDAELKFSAEMNTFGSAISKPVDSALELDGIKIGVKGTAISGDIEYELEWDLTNGERPWRDAYVNYRRFRRFQVQVGRFKMPFCLDQLSGSKDRDFVLRSRIATSLAPARDLGIMVHGRLRKKILGYQVGWFAHDGDHALASGNVAASGPAFAARLKLEPFRNSTTVLVLKKLEIGASLVRADVDEGRNSLRGRSLTKVTFFPRQDVLGQRMRWGAEARTRIWRMRLQGEFIGVSEERNAQGLFGQDLPSLISRGWYGSAAYPLIAARKNPKLELAVRAEQIRFDSATHLDVPSRSPRAASILGNSSRLLTLGATWNVRRSTRVRLNLSREVFEDPERPPAPRNQKSWTLLSSIQFSL